MTTTSPIKSKSNVCATDSTWSRVCKTDDLVANSGVCALVENKQIALFAISDSANNLQLYACDNYDPIGKANVLSRGILSSIGAEICICSPLYKQHYSLLDGRCLEDEHVSIKVYQARVEDGDVWVCAPVAATK